MPNAWIAGASRSRRSVRYRRGGHHVGIGSGARRREGHGRGSEAGATWFLEARWGVTRARPPWTTCVAASKPGHRESIERHSPRRDKLRFRTDGTTGAPKMVLTGTRNIAELLERAPLLDNLDAEAWEIAGVELLHLRYEIDDANRESLLPRALHPTIPPTAIFTAARYPDSPVGPFLLAQVRVGCRSAALPRGFLLRAYTDSPAAADALARRWGYACDVGDVKITRFHDRIVATVTKRRRRDLARSADRSGADLRRRRAVRREHEPRPPAGRRACAGAGRPGVPLPSRGARPLRIWRRSTARRGRQRASTPSTRSSPRSRSATPASRPSASCSTRTRRRSRARARFATA